MQLAYLGFGARDLIGWQNFASEVLGLSVVDATAEGHRLKMDDRPYRFILQPGDDRLAFVGWEVDSEETLTDIAERVARTGADVAEGDAKSRGVERVIHFQDPAGLNTEIVYGCHQGEPFVSPAVRSGFVAGDLGLGHLVISAKDQDQSRHFYTEILGFRMSDRIVCDIYGHHVDIVFLHANERHHSLAFGGEQPKGIHHFMLEVRSMDDVGLAYDRAIRAGVPITQTLGRHPNDRMFSFYAMTPSGFQFEFGWGGRTIDDRTWEPQTYDSISEWGHHPPAMLSRTKREGTRK